MSDLVTSVSAGVQEAPTTEQARPGEFRAGGETPMQDSAIAAAARQHAVQGALAEPEAPALKSERIG